jgi:pilus assembly protein CpaF
VTHVTEVLRMESDVVTLQDLFVARPSEHAGSLLELIRPTGIRPTFVDKLKTNGVQLTPELFDPQVNERRLALANGKGRR